MRHGCLSRHERVEIPFEVTAIHVAAPLTLALDGNAVVFPIMTMVKFSPEVSYCDAHYWNTWSSLCASSRWHTCC
jgi:hypothetical protein